MPRLTLDAGGVPLGDYIFKFDFGIVATEVCEDAWSPDGPMRRRCYSGAEIVVNVSSSPYRMGIEATRREMLATRAADNQTLLLYANAVGGQDGLILRRRRFDLSERTVGARRRRASSSGGGPQSWISIAPSVCACENSTWRTDCVDFRLQQLNVPAIDCPGANGAIAAVWRIPSRTAAASSCPRRVPSSADAARQRARRSLRSTCARRARATSRRRARFKLARHRALGWTRLDADAVGRVARCAADATTTSRRRREQRAGAASLPSTCRADTRRATHAPPRTCSPKNWRRTSHGRDRRRVRRANSKHVRAMLNGEEPSDTHAPEHPGTAARAADVELGQLAPARCSCKPAT